MPHLAFRDRLFLRNKLRNAFAASIFRTGWQLADKKRSTDVSNSEHDAHG